MALCRSAVLLFLPYSIVFGQGQLGDLNGDGQDDLLFRHVDGKFACYLDINADAGLGDRLDSGLSRSNDWHVAAQADLDGDGQVELLLRHPEDGWEYVPMSGCDHDLDETVSFSFAEPNWHIVSVLDLNNDGRDELVIRDDTGSWSIRRMDGATELEEILTPEGLPGTNEWRVVGSGSVDSDDAIDMVLRHKNGMWQSVSPSDSTLQIFTAKSLPLEGSTNWREIAIADFDGNDQSEVLLRHVSGDWKVQALSAEDDDTVSSWDQENIDSSWYWRLKGFGDIDADGRYELMFSGPSNQWRIHTISNDSSTHSSIDLGTIAQDVWYIPNPPVFIPDEALRAAISSALEIPENSWFFPRDVSSLTELRSENPSRLSAISDLRGLDLAIRLNDLRLRGHQIRELSPLIGLSHLQTLILSSNLISDLSPISYLRSLTRLELADNRISDLSPLDSLTRLLILRLQVNKITNIEPLSALSRLTTLNLAGNKIQELNGVEHLNNLLSLFLSNNKISDVTLLSSLTNLISLNLNFNSVDELSSIASLSNLETLRLFSNRISDISPLKNLTKLTLLNLAWNNISDLSGIGLLTRLESLDLSINKVVDLTELRSLSKLRRLDLENNQISDITALSELSELEFLDISNNQISDTRTLTQLPSLKDLNLSFNLIRETEKENLNLMASKGVDVNATILGQYKDSRASLTNYGYVFEKETSDPRGLLIFFHGNVEGTQQKIINNFLPRTKFLSERQGLLAIAIASPHGRDTSEPWSYARSAGDGLRFFNYYEDVDLLHEMLQSNFGGTINVDPSRVYFHGSSQGTCFLNRFISKWGAFYGGGLLADCGCSEGLDPLLNLDDSTRNGFRVFVRATTDDFLHNLSLQAYGYHKYVLGYDTRGDLEAGGGHCWFGDVTDENALKWLVNGSDASDDKPSEAHVKRVSLFDRIVGLASDAHGALWLVQQQSEPQPSATIWRSVDRGETLELMGEHSFEVYDLDIVGNSLILITPDSPLLRSNDLGRTFAPIDLDMSVANGLITTESGSELLGRVPSWKSTVLSSTHDGSLLLLPKSGTSSKILISADAGDSWSERDAPENQNVLLPDPVNLDRDKWYVTLGRVPTWIASDHHLNWRPTNVGVGVRSIAWSGSELLGITPHYGKLWESTDMGNRWARKTLPSSARVGFGAIKSADVTSVGNNDTILIGGGRDGQLYNSTSDTWQRIYGAGVIGLSSGYVRLPHRVAVDHIRGDVYITDSRGLFRIDSNYRTDLTEFEDFDDRDSDGVPDSIDHFPEDSSEYLDTDLDGIGNSQDSDDDDDGILDSEDGAPLDPLESSDLDHDGIGDRHDNDQDGDRVADVLDDFPTDRTESKDSDGDGIGDWVDEDDDNDGVEDLEDAFPLFPHESKDTDGDNIGDNIDPDPELSTQDSEEHLAAALGDWIERTSRTILMDSSKPDGLIVPDLTDGEVLYGALNLGDGTNTRVHLMLVKFEGIHAPLLYIDRRNDSDLTNDGPPLNLGTTRGIRPDNRPVEQWYRSWVEVSYASGVTLPYYLLISVNLRSKGEEAELSVGTSGRALSRQLSDGTLLKLATLDGDGDGLFNGDADFVCVDLNLDRSFSGCGLNFDEPPTDERLSHGESFEIGGWRVLADVSPSGYEIELEISERDDTSSTFARVKHLNSEIPTQQRASDRHSDITEDTFYDPLQHVLPSPNFSSP